MSRKSLLPYVSAFSLGMLALAAGTLLSQDRKPPIMRQQFEGWQLEFYRNSPTLSQISGMNATGAVIGFKELETSYRQIHFYCNDNDCQEMPILTGYSNVEANAISDNNLVVGRATKEIGTKGSLRAVVWSPVKAEIKPLPLPEVDGNGLSDAFDISADGTRITGYMTGYERLTPLVWQWDEKESQWRVEPLPTIHQYNPYLMSSQLIISPDGKTVVGCCTDKLQSNGSLDSSLYVWRKVDNLWTRQLVTEQEIYVKAINNQGIIVGAFTKDSERKPCLVTLDGKFTELDLLPGDVSGEARDINEESVIIGWSDNLLKPDGGPRPCIWDTKGKVKQLKLSTAGYGMMYAINAKGQMAGTADVVIKPATSNVDNDEQSAMLAVRITKAQASKPGPQCRLPACTGRQCAGLNLCHVAKECEI